MSRIAPADQRVLAGTAATLKMTLFDQDGAPDTGGATVTVGVDRGDGTELVADGTATTVSGTSRTYALTRAQTAATDRLTATWKVGSDTVATTIVDVVGAHWFGIDAMTARTALANQNTEDLIAVRDAWSDLADRVTGVAWVPRWGRDAFVGRYDDNIVTRWPEIRELVSVTVDGTAQVLTDYEIDRPAGIIRLPTWVATYEEVVVIYRHGYDRPPQPLVDAGLEWCEWQLTKDASGISPRALGFSNEFGNMRYASASADKPTGLPDVDAMLATYSRRTPGIG